MSFQLSSNVDRSKVFLTSSSDLTGERWDALYHLEDIFSFIRSADCEIVALRKYVCKMETGFAAGKGDQSDSESGIIQIRPTNINEDRQLVFERNVYIDAKCIEENPLGILRKGEVLFNNTNSQELVGKSVYFDLDEKFVCSNHIIDSSPDVRRRHASTTVVGASAFSTR